MQVFIDQSGKIEETNKVTIVALSNGIKKSVLISPQDKKQLQATFRSLKKHRVFVYKTFACLIFILIKDKLTEISQVIIDKEYSGHEPEIKHYLLQIIRKANKDFPKDNIIFKQIGKKSNAHILAYKVHQKKIKPDFIVNSDKLMQYLFRLK